ncbi:Alpha/beta hydrolase family protein [Thalassoglobus neptunius]|uniref:Alpha/beta hydrolase family protein n=1 Tax=Thalassoglobus neptunius TaxID=1938619 RepID=A0A5C5X7F3_9PLAN|nr:alpha/beta hydrolase [Thalassoglobus neptunius]TWT58045.1 Alpha/beta hydrolase family protein [Thalassoglobus neptunius]
METRSTRWKKRGLRWAVFAGSLFLEMLIMLALLQRKLIYAPDANPVELSEAISVCELTQDVRLDVAPGIKLCGWHSRCSSQEQASKRLVILFPGKAGNRLKRVSLLEQYHRLSCDTLIFDYRGYGGSAGSPAESDISNDSLKVWEFAVEKLGYEPSQIVCSGQSLGGGVATRLVWELSQRGTPPAGLILTATFSSLADAARVHYPWLPVKALLVEKYPSAERIGEVSCPLLIIHGKQDRIVPFELGLRLFEAAPDEVQGVRKTFVELPQAGHNDILHVAAEEVLDAKRSFLEQLSDD